MLTTKLRPSYKDDDMKNIHLYSPDAANAIHGVYPFSQTPSVFTVEDVNGRRLYVTDHDSESLNVILGKNNPLNGPSVLTPRELDDVHLIIIQEVKIPFFNKE